MEYFTESIIILYCLHLWAAYLLCRSRFEKMTTVFLCASTAVVESAVFLIFADLLEPYGAQVVYGMFALTLAISAILYLVLSEESFPRTMFILLSYVQLFLIIIFVSAAVSEIFFGGDVRVKAWIRTPLHAGVLCLYAICFKKKVDAFRQEIRGGWWAMCLLALLYTVYMTYVSMTTQSVSFNRSYVVLFVLLFAIAAGKGPGVCHSCIDARYWLGDIPVSILKTLEK